MLTFLAYIAIIYYVILGNRVLEDINNDRGFFGAIEE